MKSPAVYAQLKKLTDEKKTLGDAAFKYASKDGKLTAEEDVIFQRMCDEVGEKKAEIDRIEKAAALLDDDDDKDPRKGGIKSRSAGGNGDETTLVPLSRMAFDDDGTFADRQRRNDTKYLEGCRDYLLEGARDRNLFAQQDISGGNLVLPEMVSDKIIKKVDNILWLMNAATVIKLPRAMSLGVPTLDSDPDDADWTTEIATITADSSTAFGKRVLFPTPIRKRVLVSERFLRIAFDASFWSNDTANGKGGSPSDIVYDRMAFKIAATMEKAFYTGTGVGQPLGMYVASNNGVSTARDVVTGSATNFTYDGLVNTKYSLKVQYHRTARWDFHRNAVALILKLKDSNGRQLLNFSTVQGQLDTLLECPVQMSEYTPNTYTNGLYAGMLFDPTRYMIAQCQQITLKTANELYAETGNVGIFAGAEADGMPVLEEAYARMKCST